jgi:hypothetical protein
MSLANHKYNLRSGPFGLCSGYWDADAHVFRRANKTEEGDCCLLTAKPLVDKCVELCAKAEPRYQKLCYESCTDIRETTKANCQLSSADWGTDNPIYKGTKASGCGDSIYKLLDMECVRQNKYKILDVCRYECLPSDKLDCDQHCRYSYKMISDEKNNPLYFKQSHKSLHVKRTKGYHNNVLYGLAIAGILFGLWILVRM